MKILDAVAKLLLIHKKWGNIPIIIAIDDSYRFADQIEEEDDEEFGRIVVIDRQ